jgi:putative ABC transport system permease protein
MGSNSEVIGVLESKGSGSDLQMMVLVPLETAIPSCSVPPIHNSKRTVNSIYISVATPEKMDTVSSQVKYVLRRSHDLKNADEADFNVMSQTDLLDTLSSVTQTLTIFLGAIAGISLLVGGIGIMNIMLVSVTERTKEIGLRKAVGATRNQILSQFLIETLTLSILGGIIGILFGVTIALLFTFSGLITASISAGSIVLAFTFALAIGVFFGLYPAYRAANLHPMEALRYE